MLVVMKAHASAEDVRRVCDKIEGLGYRAHSIPGVERTAILHQAAGGFVGEHLDQTHAQPHDDVSEIIHQPGAVAGHRSLR